MTMVKTTAGSDNSETEPRADGQRNQFGRPEAQGLELKTALEICTELRTPELRRKFSGLVTGGGEERRQMLDEKKKLEDELAKERQVSKSLKQEVKCQRLQNAELKKDLSNTLRSQDANTRKRGAVNHRERIPQKRQRTQQSSDDEYEDPSYYPCERVVGANLPVGVSREQIRDVLGGWDRGWGSMQKGSSCPGRYRDHVLLDLRAHLFGQTPTRGRDVNEGVFGFGLENSVISGAIVFPLFVRGLSKNLFHFTYLGNYVAIRLDPVAWKRLSEEGKERAVETTRSKGLSQDPYFHSKEKSIKSEIIRDKFHSGDFEVPCSRLEFQHFDEKLNTDVRNSRGRKR